MCTNWGHNASSCNTRSKSNCSISEGGVLCGKAYHKLLHESETTIGEGTFVAIFPMPGTQEQTFLASNNAGIQGTDNVCKYNKMWEGESVIVVNTNHSAEQEYSGHTVTSSHEDLSNQNSALFNSEASEPLGQVPNMPVSKHPSMENNYQQSSAEALKPTSDLISNSIVRPIGCMSDSKSCNEQLCLCYGKITNQLESLTYLVEENAKRICQIAETVNTCLIENYTLYEIWRLISFFFR